MSGGQIRAVTPVASGGDERLQIGGVVPLDGDPVADIGLVVALRGRVENPFHCCEMGCWTGFAFYVRVASIGAGVALVFPRTEL